MKHHSFYRSALAFLLALVMASSFLPIPARAATSAEIKEELSELKSRNAEIQAQINEIQAKYDANADEIRALVEKKNGIDQQIALLHEQILNINEQIRIYGQLIADSQDQLDDATLYLNQLSEKHRERIRAMEEQGVLTYWQVIFESASFTDLLDRMDMVDEIAAADQRRLEEMKAASDRVLETQQQLTEEKEEMKDAQFLLQQSEAELDEKRTESDELLRQLAQRQEEFQAMLDESEDLQDDLMLEIAAKQRELQAAQYKEELARLALQGQNPPSNAKWQVPVSGYTITSPFGNRLHPVYGYYRMHNGIDMACAQGTPIYATRAGTVTTASYQAGGAGYYVSISHGDGFASIYMHMTHYVVSAGQSVSQGQLIGYVGSTGVSTGPHLHFGISYGGTYVNPLAYI